MVLDCFCPQSAVLVRGPVGKGSPILIHRIPLYGLSQLAHLGRVTKGGSMHKLLSAAVALAVLSTPAIGAPCRDGKGKFVKCVKVVKKVVRCRDAKGHFVKCK